MMSLNCGAGEDCWESLGLQGDQTSHPKGNQPWIFIRTDAETEAPILWPPGMKSSIKICILSRVKQSWLIGKDPDAGKDWRQNKKRATEEEMVRWYHQLKGHECEQTPGYG